LANNFCYGIYNVGTQCPC